MEIVELRNEISGDVQAYVASLPATITDADTYVLFANELKEVKRRISVVTERLEKPKKEARQSWQNWIDLEKELTAPLLEREAHNKKEMRKWDDEQERIRKEEERRLQEEARRREEEERLAAAIAAEQDGAPEEAEAILEEKPYVAPVVVMKATPQVSGISYRENWKHQVTNLMDLVKAVAAGRVPINAIKADDVFLGQQARSLKGSMNYPGVKVYSEKTVAAGKR